jgi:hypothetical protein
LTSAAITILLICKPVLPPPYKAVMSTTKRVVLATYSTDFILCAEEYRSVGNANARCELPTERSMTSDGIGVLS